MKLLKIIVFATLLGLVTPAHAWDRTRHDAIAYIADCNLTKKARKNIARYLEHPIVYYSTFMDKYRDTPEYSHVEHVGYADENLQHVDKLRKGKRDCVGEVLLAIDRLKDYKQMNDSLVRLNLCYIIHIVGDMHCPSHVKYSDVKSFRTNLNGADMSYHAAWDWGVLQGAHGWSYTEYQQQLDHLSKQEIAEICKGTPQEWFHQSAVGCRVIYDWAKPGEKLGKPFVNATYLLPERQLVKAGYRLAAVLNELFG